MQRGPQVGLLLLVVQLLQEGVGNVPAVTMAVMGFNVYLYAFPAAAPPQACVSLELVYQRREWRRLFLSPLHHVDDWHLHFNMAFFLWKGVALERRLGGARFLYLLSVFSLLTGLVYLLLQALMAKLAQDSGPGLAGFADVSSLKSECAVGFSGVLFALKVVSNHYNPGGVTYVVNIRVSNRFASWVELVLIYLIAPGTSLVCHLAGILVGLLYTVGPLKTVMEACAEFVSSDVNNPQPSSFYSSSGYSRTRRESSEQPRPAGDHTTDHTSDFTESYVAGLSEQEQIELAIRRSLSDTGQTKQREAAVPSSLTRRRVVRSPQEEETEIFPGADDCKDREGGHFHGGRQFHVPHEDSVEK